ncbi:MAG: hypothetical protein PHO75_00475 [Candidatus Shapirobacteria bacterium]|jgi:hypothetical protein|nr:hypothetical protein [Candidatus Shapirobacteria bacterium]
MRLKDKSIWVIKLPTKAKILVKVGDRVEVGDKLAVFNSHKVETFDYSGKLFSISDDVREDLNNSFKNKMVKIGDIFCTLGIFKNKVCFPATGLCLGLDEFRNLIIEMVEDEKKEIFTPVEARVSKIEEGKMVLEFKAKEYKGEGLTGLKAWGQGKIKIIDEIKFLNYELDGNVLFTSNLDKAFLFKAIVVGVKAVIVNGNKDIKEVDLKLPILRLEDQIWNDFMKNNLGKERKMLVNALKDKLLLVLE